MKISPMKRRILLLFVAAIAVAGCDAFSSEPTYSGLSVEGFNYTPYNLDEFVIRDKFGNTASGGGDLMPGAGEGSLSCCYKLKGTDFTVEWDVYDADIAMTHPYDPIKEIHYTSHVHLPPTKVDGGAGDLVLGLHFYPDSHVEFEFRNDLSGTRIEYADVWDWLAKNHKQLIDPESDIDAVVFRRSARIAAAGWLKYRFVNTEDLEQYCYFHLLSPKFDENPAVQRILAETKGKPGAFGAAMRNLPDATVQEIRSGRTHDADLGAQHG
jgi:hypothetical protein